MGVPQRYIDACNYPGLLDANVVEQQLTIYLRALGVTRQIRQLQAGWCLDDEPALSKNVNMILDDLCHRNPNARAARDARDALDARAALDALDARAARDALDALDARDALSSIKRFTAWCLQSSGWWWARWDLSWIVTAAFGANTPAVKAWSDPLLEAFIAGAWFLYWTEDTLYWVAKPTVHIEPTETGRRLHNDSYAALESDIENLYFWHGVLVPAFVIVRPDWITVKHIENETNAEVRRVMVSRYGEDKYILDSGLLPVSLDDFGELYCKEFADDTPLTFVKVRNSTAEPDGSFKDYFLSVNPSHYNGDAGRIPHAAVASTWRTTPGGSTLFFERWQDYRPGIET